ncbi:heme-binding domain-containing protein [Daejeonella oryzae]|uniref:heme-binding domain-containing protein n=1 Tax=Daejeonella oryzae TaxID=1122943 RepID=UPI000426B357|nr:heme-binding domain-containing protein [Daejeonella oryzae]
MSRTQKILIGVLAIIILIQFIRPAKNISVAATPNDIFEHYQAPDTLKQLIKTACYDCHSNNTVYPWYSNIQPVAWWLNDHVEEGKSKLNFSEFATYTAKKGDHKLEEVMEEVKEGNMPLKSYTLIHTKTKLNTSQREAIVQWAMQTRKQIQPNIQ